MTVPEEIESAARKLREGGHSYRDIGGNMIFAGAAFLAGKTDRRAMAVALRAFADSIEANPTEDPK